MRQRLIVITRMFPGPQPVASKVPTIGIGFWVVKVLTTGMGEAASDFLGKLNLLLAAVVGLGGIWYALRLQFRADRYRPATYWFAVAMVAVFGTMAADAVHIVLFLPYPVTTTLYALATAAALTCWYRSEGTLSIHSITSRRREQFYWTTVLATFTLGTAAGDLTASTLHLGFFASGVLFAAAIVIPLVGWWRLRLNPVVAFWSAYVLTRPLGASFADWMGKPHKIGGGLGFGDGLVTAGASLLIVGGVWLLARAADGARQSVRPAAA